MELTKLPLLILLHLLPRFALTQSTQTVQVGFQGLQFLPNTIYAGVNSKVEFQFVAPNHNVVQGSYSRACQPSGNSSFYSGPSMAVGKSFTITVADSSPIWFYCSTASHCQAGMVGVINPPSSDQTLNGYRSAAGSAAGSSSPASAQGGVAGSASSSSTSAGTSPTTSSASAATTSAKSEGIVMKGSTFLGAFAGMVGAGAAWLI